MLRDGISKSLDYAQGILKVDLKYYLKSGFWISFSNFWSMGAQLLVSLAYANFLPVYVFGVYKYITSTAAILGSLTLTGMNTAVTQAVANGNEGSFKKSIKYQIKWNLLYLVVSLAISLYYFLRNDSILGLAFLILAIIQPISFIGNTYVAYLHGLKDFKKFSEYTIISVTLTSLATIAAAYFFQNVIIILLANLGVTMLFNVLWLYVCLKRVKNDLEDKDSNRYGRHLSILNALSNTASYLDYIIIYHLLGPASLAIYTFAILVPDALKGFTKFIAVSGLPRFSIADEQTFRKSLAHKIFLFFLLLLCITVIYHFGAHYLYEIIFPKYTDITGLSIFYSYSIPLAVTVIPLTFLQAKKKTKHLFQYAMAGSILQILSNIILIPILGLNGAIISKYVGASTNLIVSLYLSYKD